MQTVSVHAYEPPPGRRAVAGCIATLFTVFVVHVLSPVGLSGDSKWTVLVALSMLKRHTTNLDPYTTQIKAHGYNAVKCVGPGGEVREAEDLCAGGHIYNSFPIGTPLVAAPAVLALEGSAAVLGPWFSATASNPTRAAFWRGDFVAAHAVVELIVASSLVALSASLIYLTAAEFVSQALALLPAFVFAFATSAWSVASRALFQHTPSMLAISLTLYLMVVARRKPWAVQLVSIPVGLSYVIRPTNALFVVVISLYVLRCHRKQFALYLLGIVAVTGLFLTYNWSIYRSLFPPYYSLRPELPVSGPALLAFAKALAGNLISPSRGLFVFTPVLIFSIWGMVVAWRARWQWPLSGYLACLPLAHWVVISLYSRFWWGGYSYGPRLFTDMIPVLVFFLVPVLQRWSTLRRWRWSVAMFVASLCMSVAVHGLGAMNMAVHRWNDSPVSVDRQPGRVWDWSDPQFLHVR